MLFLDEPTTGLDPTSRAALWREVRSLNEEGTTVFLTTQYLEEAEQPADRVGIIAGGRLVAEGTPEGLKAHLGQPTVNIEVRDPEAAPRALEALAGLGMLEPPSPQAPTRLALRSSAGKGRPTRRHCPFAPSSCHPGGRSSRSRVTIGVRKTSSEPFARMVRFHRRSVRSSDGVGGEPLG